MSKNSDNHFCILLCFHGYRAYDEPTVTKYDYNCVLPLTNETLMDMMSYMDSVSYENDTSPDRSSFITETPNKWICFFSNDVLNVYVCNSHVTK